MLDNTDPTPGSLKRLTPLPLDAVRYCLNLVGEEGTEVSKEVNKIFRFGLEDIRPSTGEDNLQVLQNEITDFVAVVHTLNLELVKRGLPAMKLDDHVGIQRKQDKVAFYAARSMERGTLAEPLIIMT